MAKKTKKTRRSKPDWAKKFLDSVRVNANIKAACEVVKVNRSNVYKRRDSDQEFADALSLALEDAADELEREAWRRAVEGTERVVYHQGGEVGRYREYSDTLLSQLLRANRPQKYRDVKDVNFNGTLKGNVNHTHAVKNPFPSLEALRAYTAALADGTGGIEVSPDGRPQPLDTSPAAPQAGVVPAGG